MPTPEHHRATNGAETWKVRFRLDRKATSRTFTSDAGANAFVKLLADVGPKRAVEVLDARNTVAEGTLTVEQWCTKHIDALSGVQKDTLDKYRSYVKNDLGKLAAMPITAVMDDDVSAWVNELAKKIWRGKPVSGKTVKNKHGFLSAAFKRAEARGLVPSNPCHGTTLPRTIKEPMTPLAVPEYLRFRESFTPHWQPLVQTLFETGLRWGEATALQVGDLDLKAVDAAGDPAPTLRIERAWKKSGKLGPP